MLLGDTKDSNRYPPFFLVAGTLLLFYWRFGYQYGGGDHDEMLPLLLNRLNAHLFANDWFVMSQAEGFHVRTYFLTLLEIPASLFSPFIVITTIYLAAWLVIAYQVYRLAYDLMPNRTAASFTLVATLVLSWKWTLGGNELVYNHLVPEMLGWAFALPALRYAMHGRYLPATALLGAATWFHPLVGLLIAFVLWLSLVLKLAEYQAKPGKVLFHCLSFAVGYIIFASPALVPIALEQLSSNVNPMHSEEIFYVLAQFRLPHHHLFFSFSPASMLQFGVLVVLGIFGFEGLRRIGRISFHLFWIKFVSVSLFLCLVAFFFTEAQPVLAVAKLQVFKLTVAVKVFLLAAFSGWLSLQLPGRLTLSLDSWLRKNGGGLALVATLYVVTTLLIFLSAGRPYQKAHALVHQKTALGQVEQWALNNTPSDAVFAIPPSIDTFRSNARRSVVVNYKAFPFQDENIPIWLSRLTEVAPIPLPYRGIDVLPLLDGSFHAHDADAWRRLSEKYEIDYLLVNTRQLKQNLRFPRLYTRGDWAVYHMPDRP